MVSTSVVPYTQQPFGLKQPLGHLNHSTENAKESRANAHPFGQDFVNLLGHAFGIIQRVCAYAINLSTSIKFRG